MLTSEKESHGFKYQPPPKKESENTKEQDLFSERLNRTVSAFHGLFISYDPPDYSTRKQNAREKANVILQKEYGEKYVSKEFLGMTRVLLSNPNMFENEDGKIDNSVKSALVYHVQITIENPDSVNNGIRGDILDVGGAQCMYTIGRYNYPKIKPSYKDHELIEKRVVGYTNRYYIKDTPQNIKEILKMFGQNIIKSNPWTVAIGYLDSISMPYGQRAKYSVYDKDEFINTPIDKLIKANKEGFLESNKKGGVEEFERYSKKREKKYEEGKILTAEKFKKDEDSNA